MTIKTAQRLAALVAATALAVTLASWRNVDPRQIRMMFFGA